MNRNEILQKMKEIFRKERDIDLENSCEEIDYGFIVNWDVYQKLSTYDIPHSIHVDGFKIPFWPDKTQKENIILTNPHCVWRINNEVKLLKDNIGSDYLLNINPENNPYDCITVSLNDIINWIKQNKPELL